MHQQTSSNPDVSVTFVAHQDGNHKLLMARVVAAANEKIETQPVEIALVIDRSGSMGGGKLQIVKEACARLIRALSPRDRVAVAIYDTNVEVISPLTTPSETLAATVARLEPGGSTNLYGGWLQGAKLLNADGRIILLSDGLANCGRYTDAMSLAQHAGRTREQFQKVTSTIGVGVDYDEALMAGMARQGGGSHYFAHDPNAIMKAFSEEQFSIDQMVLTDVRLIVNSEEHFIGSLWGGEIKTLVIPNASLTGDAILVYNVRATGKTCTLPLLVPDEFGQDDEVTLEYLIQQVTDLEAEMVQVHSREAARVMYDRLRRVVMKLMSHPLADSEKGQAVINSTNGTLDRLNHLARTYDEQAAMLHRKRSMQKFHNLSQRAKAYSSFDDGEDNPLAFLQMSRSAAEGEDTITPDPRGLQLAPVEQWARWRAVPVEVLPHRIEVAMLDPKDGMLIREMERDLGIVVQPIYSFYSEMQIARALEELAHNGI